MEHTHQQPTARWNQSRDCWEAPEDPIFGPPAVFSETWPASGTMRSGELYLPPASEHPTGATAYSSLPGDEAPLLPTVSAAETTGGIGFNHQNQRWQRGGQMTLEAALRNSAEGH